MSKHHRHENDCLNCGAELQGHFCHVCGQENMHVKEPFWHFVGHSISHYFHFDSKFFSTIKPLLTQPGQLTLDYLAGRRARYLHPISMYIFVSIVYFLIVPNLHLKNESEDAFNFKFNNKNIDQLPADSLEAARKEVLNLPINDENKKLTLKKIDAAEQIAKARGVKIPSAGNKPGVTKKISDDTSNDEDITIDIGKPYPGFVSPSVAKQEATLDSLKEVYKQHPTDSLKTKIRAYKKILYREKYANGIGKKSRSWIGKIMNVFNIFDRPDFNKELEHYMPKMYFILMPLFAFFLSWSFRRNHRYYVEHLVFTVHFFTAFFIFEIVVKPIEYLFRGTGNSILFGDTSIFAYLTIAAVLWYCYTALRAFYQRPPWKTIRKMVTLSISYLIALSISYSIIVSLVYMIAEK